jgi:hypothetical protein
MAALHRAVATLRISGDAMNPDEVSSLLGAQPTFAQRKGQEMQTLPDRPIRVARYGLWRLKAPETLPEDLDHQVSELLSRLTPDLIAWKFLAENFRVDLFCGWFMKEGNEGVDISPTTLLALGERQISLALDIYGPDSDA